MAGSRSIRLGRGSEEFPAPDRPRANVARFFREDKNWGFIPAHAGYRQLRIIEEKLGNWALARALCKQAKAEGWADDWDHHIGRIDKKLAAMKTQV